METDLTQDDEAIILDAVEAILLAEVREQCLHLTGDQRVDASSAAQLIGLSRDDLWRLGYAQGPRSLRRGGRKTYQLCDLATWLIHASLSPLCASRAPWWRHLPQSCHIPDR